MKNETITIKQATCTLTLNDARVFNSLTILKGSQCESVKSTLTNRKVLLLRENNLDANLCTTNDVVFYNFASALQFIYGASQKTTDFYKKFNFSSDKQASIQINQSTQNREQEQEQKQVLPTINREPKEEQTSTQNREEQKLAIGTRLGDVANKMSNLFLEIGWTIDDTPLVNRRVFNNFVQASNIEDARATFEDYCLITDAPQDVINTLNAKMQSIEFKTLYEETQNIKKDAKKIDFTIKKMNKRFDLYFGGAGTGKTTKAMRENPHAIVVVASPTKDPENAFGVFDMKTKLFTPSIISECAKSGETLIIDEILLYSDEFLIRLQGLLDGKDAFTDDVSGEHITIHPNFKIIATCNRIRALPCAVATRANLFNFDKKYKPSWCDFAMSMFEEE